jgi:hypothetical protein
MRALVQVPFKFRAQDVLPAAIGTLVLRALEAHREAIDAGALVTIDEASARVQILSIR